jgi:aryl-alcohol dehydrogenase-like predicted oxidoreductase
MNEIHALPGLDRVPLGRSGIQIPPLGVGTWQWGDRIWWQYGGRYGDEEIHAAYNAAVSRGVRLFDTAEIYGLGKSERLLGELSRDDHEVLIATKFFPFPWRLRSDAMSRALAGSLRRLGHNHVDLYQVHWPLPPMPLERWMDGLVRVLDAGLTRAVGVSNFNQRQMARAVQRLQAGGAVLASNQISYSLLNRTPENNGVLACSQALGVTVIAYSPLAMGMLSGKYSEEHPPPGMRRRRFPPARLRAIVPLISALREIGGKRRRTPSQVALNWVICKGAIPIPGAKNAMQAEENAGALGWRLSADEMAELDALSERFGEPR